MGIYSGEKLYFCDVSESAFLGNSEIHMGKYNGDKPYPYEQFRSFLYKENILHQRWWYLFKFTLVKSYMLCIL